MDNQLTVQQYMKQPAIAKRIEDLLKSRANSFMITISAMVSQNALLAKCEPNSLVMAALTATAMNLPINQNLGFAYIIPYKQKDGTYVAQMQLGYKAFIQLSQNSQQFRTINVSDVREGELTSNDRLTGELTFTWADEQDRQNMPIVGYVGYIELISGFRKSLYMTASELKQHGNKFSQTSKRGFGLWVDDFDSMAKKTVIKLLLSKYAPLSTDIQKAVLVDQSVINDEDDYKYPDNQPLQAEDVALDKETAKVLAHIEKSHDIEELKLCKEYVTEDTQDAYMKKYEELQALKVEKPKK